MKYFLLPIIISLIVQAIKIGSDIYKKKFSWHRALGYGGMPSSHAALVSSLATSTYLATGLSPMFGITVILALIVVRDALGFRGYLQQYGRMINKLIKDLPDDKEFKYPVLEETIAHTPMQLLVGTILGILLTIAFFR